MLRRRWLCLLRISKSWLSLLRSGPLPLGSPSARRVSTVRPSLLMLVLSTEALSSLACTGLASSRASNRPNNPTTQGLVLGTRPLWHRGARGRRLGLLCQNVIGNNCVVILGLARLNA